MLQKYDDGSLYPGYCRSIETQKQLYILTEQGCNKVQGYYYSKPLPADEVEQIFFRKINDNR